MKETATHHLSKPVGEVVQASTTEITSHCYRLYEAPPLGSGNQMILMVDPPMAVWQAHNL